jgi:hypothetical protein
MYQSNLTYQTLPPATTNTDHCSVTPMPGNGCQLKLTGKFPPRWLANLTGGLSAQGINVLRGYANKVSPTTWEGTFEITPARGGVLTPGLDYIAMTRSAPIATGETHLALDRFIIRPHDGSLYVEVLGADSVGFLMTLLKLFAFYSLYPAEVSIDTPGGRVHDRFWLKGLAGMEPTASVADVLREELGKRVASA